MAPQTHTDTNPAPRRRTPLAAAREFIAELRAAYPNANADEICRHYIAACRDHVNSDALWQDRILDLVEEWLRVNVRDRRVRTVEEAAQRKAETNAIVERIAAADEKRIEVEVATRFLEMITPNGRKLRDCTGAMCKRFGGFFAEIGKRLNANDHVGRHLTEVEVAAIAKTYRIEAGEC